MKEVRRRINELHDFVKDKSIVHKAIKEMVMGIKSAMIAAELEQVALRTIAVRALIEAKEKSAAESQETPKRSRNPRSLKRKKETPGEEEELKKLKNDKEDSKEERWRTVEEPKEKWKKRKEKEVKKKEEQNKEQPRPRRERSTDDALIVQAKDKTTYAALLRKVREDPELKELGESVLKTRCTQKGEMLFELKKDPSFKSTAFKKLVEMSLGEGASVRALSQ
ncbi:uncharacterized protein LOC135710592 [Ochlerotatus camptorhynchus]|uniref:uncharacterized protein LOC135710592 n=1 Tax=Ochlerotatus camptorhynchus TaxID=644619 RepID=UPI0031D1E9C3